LTCCESLYIDALPDWQQAICHQVRELVHAPDPEVQETIKRKVQPYFVLQGNISALLATQDHVNVFLYDGGIVPYPKGIITGGHDNKTARTVALYREETLNATALRTMFAQIMPTAAPADGGAEERVLSASLVAALHARQPLQRPTQRHVP